MVTEIIQELKKQRNACFIAFVVALVLLIVTNTIWFCCAVEPTTIGNTKTVIPNDSVCPGWGTATVSVTTGTTTA